jgi:carbon monoxide dehydrogenase subunit G
MKTFEVNHQILVKAPIERVFQVWTDFEHWPQLYPDTYESVSLRKEGDVLVTEEVIKTIAGKQKATLHTRLEPPHRYTRDFTDGAMEGSQRVTTLETTAEGTLVKTTMNVKLGGMIATMIGDLAETLFLKNLEKLSRSHARVAENKPE